MTATNVDESGIVIKQQYDIRNSRQYGFQTGFAFQQRILRRLALANFFFQRSVHFLQLTSPLKHPGFQFGVDLLERRLRRLPFNIFNLQDSIELMQFQRSFQYNLFQVEIFLPQLILPLFRRQNIRTSLPGAIIINKGTRRTVPDISGYIPANR